MTGPIEVTCRYLTSITVDGVTELHYSTIEQGCQQLSDRGWWTGGDDGTTVVMWSPEGRVATLIDLRRSSGDVR